MVATRDFPSECDYCLLRQTDIYNAEQLKRRAEWGRDSSASNREWWSSTWKSNDVRKTYWTPYAPLRILQEPCKPNRWQFPTKYDDLIKNTYLHTKLMKIIDFNICIFLQSLKELRSFTINPEMRKNIVRILQVLSPSVSYPIEWSYRVWFRAGYILSMTPNCFIPFSRWKASVFTICSNNSISGIADIWKENYNGKKNKSGGTSIEINQIRYKKSSRYTQKIYKALYRIKCSLS